MHGFPTNPQIIWILITINYITMIKIILIQTYNQ